MMGNGETNLANMEPEDFEVENYTNNPIMLIIDGKMNVVREAVQKLDEANLTFAFKHDEVQNIEAPLTHCLIAGLHEYAETYITQMKMVNMEISKLADMIFAEMNTLQTTTASLLQDWHKLKLVFDDQLQSFKQNQRLYANGRKFNMDTSGLQRLAEYLMTIAWNLRQSLITVQRVCLRNASLLVNGDNQTLTLPDLLISKVTELITTLVQETFIVVHQPCQVVKPQTRFHVEEGKSPTEVRLLVGSMLGLNLSPPAVSVKIINESTHRDLQDNGLNADLLDKNRNEWRLTSPNRRFKFSQSKLTTKAVFNQLFLRNFSRTENNRERQVVEKLYLVFRSEFHVGNERFNVWTTSFPIHVVTDSNQESLAWGRATWDNEFFHEDNEPDRASWLDVRKILNCKFSSVAGAPLTEDNLQHLAETLSEVENFPISMSWADLCKHNLPGRNFTFWEWFFGIAELVREHLQDAWINGLILGFMEKGQSEKLLDKRTHPVGTFLIRFSDSMCGAISIVWLHSNGQAYSGEPFEIKSLANQPLVERLKQEGFIYLYPNTPKEVAFKKYFDEYNEALTKRKNGGIITMKSYLAVRSHPEFSTLNIRQSEFPLEASVKWDDADMEEILRCVNADLSKHMGDSFYNLKGNEMCQDIDK